MDVSNLPDYWLRRPEWVLDKATRAAFEATLADALADGAERPMRYTLGAPKWQFLCYLAETRGFALHGSQQPDIAEFEPRQPYDLHAFGAQNAVYAAADGIWPMYFAILDRARYPTSMINACIRILMRDGTTDGPYYHFSVSQRVIDQRPWRSGLVYILPRESFIAQPPFHTESAEVDTAQLASLVSVRPLAKLGVDPEDFPFLAHMRSHDDDRLAEYAAAMQNGAPWPDDVT